METLEKSLAAGKTEGVVLARSGAYALRLAADVADLQAALALESAASADPRLRPAARRPGIAEPSAVPLCDFLLLCDRDGAPQGVIRVLPHGSRDFSRFAPQARLAYGPLFTALRYAALGAAEVGPLVLSPEAARRARASENGRASEAGRGPEDEMIAALWGALPAYLKSRNLDFALGWETARPASEEQTARLVEEFAVFGASRAGKFAGRPAASAPEGGRAWLPPGLREALRRGARLAGDPLRQSGGDCDFLWVTAGGW